MAKPENTTTNTVPLRESFDGLRNLRPEAGKSFDGLHNLRPEAVQQPAQPAPEQPQAPTPPATTPDTATDSK